MGLPGPGVKPSPPHRSDCWRCPPRDPAGTVGRVNSVGRIGMDKKVRGTCRYGVLGKSAELTREQRENEKRKKKRKKRTVSILRQFTSTFHIPHLCWLSSTQRTSQNTHHPKTKKRNHPKKKKKGEGRKERKRKGKPHTLQTPKIRIQSISKPTIRSTGAVGWLVSGRHRSPNNPTFKL